MFCSKNELAVRIEGHLQVNKKLLQQGQQRKRRQSQIIHITDRLTWDLTEESAEITHLKNRIKKQQDTLLSREEPLTKVAVAKAQQQVGLKREAYSRSQVHMHTRMGKARVRQILRGSVAELLKANR